MTMSLQHGASMSWKSILPTPDLTSIAWVPGVWGVNVTSESTTLHRLGGLDAGSFSFWALRPLL